MNVNGDLYTAIKSSYFFQGLYPGCTHKGPLQETAAWQGGPVVVVECLLVGRYIKLTGWRGGRLPMSGAGDWGEYASAARQPEVGRFWGLVVLGCSRSFFLQLPNWK